LRGSGAIATYFAPLRLLDAASSRYTDNNGVSMSSGHCIHPNTGFGSDRHGHVLAMTTALKPVASARNARPGRFDKHGDIRCQLRVVLEKFGDLAGLPFGGGVARERYADR